MKKSEFYISRGIIRRWQQAASESQGLVVVFSPYITSRTAEVVLLACQEKGNCHVYTLFEPDVFINRSPSLSTLRRLKRAGVSLYSLPNLHAKLFITPNVFASIGSQNLTAGGTKRREATVVTTDPQVVAWIWNDVEDWRTVATPISEEMLQDMQTLLLPHLRKAKRLTLALKEVSDEVEKREAVRRELRRLADEEARIESERKRKLEELREQTSQHWKATPKARRTIRTKVAVSQGGTITLLRTVDATLTNWILEDNSSISLSAYSCYPCLISDGWKLGFARVTKSRITFIGNRINWNEWHEIADQTCKITFDADWSNKEHKNANVTCRLEFHSRSRLPSVALSTWFDLHDLQIADPVVISGTVSDNDKSTVIQWLADNRAVVKRKVLLQLLTPFSYEHPLSQSKAIQFFGPVGTRYRLSVGKVENRPVIVAAKMY